MVDKWLKRHPRMVTGRTNQKDIIFDGFKELFPSLHMKKRLSKIWLSWWYFLLLLRAEKGPWVKNG